MAQHVAYLVSFLTIGVIWLNHHRIFEQVARTASALYSGMLLVMGLAFGAVFAWVTHTDRLLHRLPPPAVVRAARLRFMFGQAVYAAAFGLSWVSAPLALALCGLMAVYYASTRRRCPLP